MVLSLLVRLRSLSIVVPRWGGGGGGGGGGGDARSIFEYRFETLILSWFETLTLFKKKKNPEIHGLFDNTFNFITLFRRKGKMHAVLF